MDLEVAKNDHDMRDYQCMLWPSIDQEILPSQWNRQDAHSKLDLLEDEITVKYIGPGKNDTDAATVRANHAIPPSCGVFYFEITIMNKGREGYIGIGLSEHSVKLDRLPGWEKHSYGYHGDDGHFFGSSVTGQPYGATFTTGDVIGCCVDFVNNTCSFNKNGIHQGIAFTGLRPGLYPCVGMRTQNEQIRANFGQQPFLFDIVSFMQGVKSNTLSTIRNTPITDCLPLINDSFDTTLCTNSDTHGSITCARAMHEIINSYLVHLGYITTATLFAKDAGVNIKEDGISITNRPRIKECVMQGDIDQALSLIDHTYPSFLSSHTSLHFQLKRQRFIEMIANGVADNERDLSDIILYGRELQAACPSDDADIKAALVEAFGLLAYKDPYHSPVAFLLDIGQREGLADELNSSILASLNFPKVPALEVLLRHTDTCLRMCLDYDVGEAALVKMKDFMPSDKD